MSSADDKIVNHRQADREENSSIDPNRSVAFIITHTIKAGNEKFYEEWNRDIFNAVSKFPGYLGREVFLPTAGSRKYTIIVRFDNYENLNTWTESETRQQYIDQVRDLLEKGDQHEIRSGIDFWFTPPQVKPPKRYKQTLVTISAIYPLTIIIPQLISFCFSSINALDNFYIKGLLSTIVICALMSYVIMPRYTQWMSKWLYDNSE
jgi:uncharacterized protein